jgi:hypothetical protein
MNNEKRQHLEELLKESEKRLRILELRAVRQGHNAPPEILLEIKDIREQTQGIEVQLASTTPEAGPRMPAQNQNTPTEILKEIEEIKKKIESIDAQFADPTPNTRPRNISPKRNWPVIAILSGGVVGLLLMLLFIRPDTTGSTLPRTTPPPGSVATRAPFVATATADTPLQPTIAIESSLPTAPTTIPAQPTSITVVSSPTIGSTLPRTTPPPGSVATRAPFVATATADTPLQPTIAIESSLPTAPTTIPAQPTSITVVSSPTIASTTVPTVELCVMILEASPVGNVDSNTPSLQTRVFIYPEPTDGSKPKLGEPINLDIRESKCRSVELLDSNVINVRIQVFDMNQGQPINFLAVSGPRGVDEAVKLKITPATSRDDPCTVYDDVKGKCDEELRSSGTEAKITFLISMP